MTDAQFIQKAIFKGNDSFEKLNRQWYLRSSDFSLLFSHLSKMIQEGIVNFNGKNYTMGENFPVEDFLIGENPALIRVPQFKEGIIESCNSVEEINKFINSGDFQISKIKTACWGSTIYRVTPEPFKVERVNSNFDTSG